MKFVPKSIYFSAYFDSIIQTEQTENSVKDDLLCNSVSKMLRSDKILSSRAFKVANIYLASSLTRGYTVK